MPWGYLWRQSQALKRRRELEDEYRKRKERENAMSEMSEETKKLVEEHMETCLECGEIDRCEKYWVILLEGVRQGNRKENN